MRPVEAARSEAIAVGAQRREQLRRRLGWHRAGTELAELRTLMASVWPGGGVGVDTVLRELAERGEAVERGGRWFSIAQGRADVAAATRDTYPGVGIQGDEDLERELEVVTHGSVPSSTTEPGLTLEPQPSSAGALCAPVGGERTSSPDAGATAVRELSAGPEAQAGHTSEAGTRSATTPAWQDAEREAPRCATSRPPNHTRAGETMARKDQLRALVELLPGITTTQAAERLGFRLTHITGLASGAGLTIDRKRQPFRLYPGKATETKVVDPEQPPPAGGTGDVWAELISRHPESPILDKMSARREQGIAQYGQPLRRGDGRDAMRDLLDELLDAAVYAEKLGLRGLADLQIQLAEDPRTETWSPDLARQLEQEVEQLDAWRLRIGALVLGDQVVDPTPEAIEAGLVGLREQHERAHAERLELGIQLDAARAGEPRDVARIVADLEAEIEELRAERDAQHSPAVDTLRATVEAPLEVWEAQQAHIRELEDRVAELEAELEEARRARQPRISANRTRREIVADLVRDFAPYGPAAAALLGSDDEEALPLARGLVGRIDHAHARVALVLLEAA